MAVTETYVDFATGNDYSGATFTDGAYTSATKTLVKASAFTKNKAGHWLYLASNDGGSIVAGYYKIATWTDANTVVLATDAGAGVDDDAAKCIQADGTSGKPFRSIQGALDLITRNATDGNRINVVAGTAQTLSAALSYTTYGTPTDTARLIIQGCTSSAGDGGIGEIDGGASYGVCSAWTYVTFADLKIGNCGADDVLDLGIYSCVLNCEIHTSSGIGIDLGSNNIVCGCWLHTLTGTQAIDNANYCTVAYCYFDVSITSRVIDGGIGSSIIGNIINAGGADTNFIGIMLDAANIVVIGNTVFCSNANISAGINVSNQTCLVLNNVVEGWSGEGGYGITQASYMGFVGANAVANCTTPYDLSITKLNYAIAPNDTLGSSPFTSASTDDFSIKDSQTGVTEDAYPSTFRGM